MIMHLFDCTGLDACRDVTSDFCKSANYTNISQKSTNFLQGQHLDGSCQGIYEDYHEMRAMMNFLNVRVRVSKQKHGKIHVKKPVSRALIKSH